MRRLSVLVLLVCTLWVTSSSAAAPLRVEISAIEEQPGKIVATVGAYGTDGKPLSALTTSDFRASLNDAALTVTDVQVGLTRQPASILLLVDTSGSMAGEPMVQAKRALTDFIQGLDARDQAAIISFESKVTLQQAFTTDRALLDAAVGRLVAVGETALYDAIIEATKRVAEAGPGRKMIVLLSDGLATTSLNQRAASIAAAKATGVSFVSVGLGAGIDRAFLTELGNATGGRLIEATNAALLRQSYVDLAAAIRNQYSVTLAVPPSIDRRQPAKLNLRLTVRADTAVAERQLDALPGAVPPPFEMNVSGMTPGDKLTAPTTILPAAGAEITFSKVDYIVDGAVVHSATQAPFSFSLDPGAYPAGSHTLKVVATEPGGRSGESQTPFLTVAPPVPSEPIKIPWTPMLMVAAVIAGGGLLWLLLTKRRSANTVVVHRVMPFTVRGVAEMSKPVEGWPEPPPEPPPAVIERSLGRVVVMNEEAIRSGSFDAIREYEIGTSPLTLGTGDHCEVQVIDEEGRIAAEEARLWVQKGRLVYHKLTTLSAMATEGVTSGWQILDSGEEIQIGPYRVLYQADVVPEPEVAPVVQPNWDEPARFGDLWSRYPDESPLGTQSD